MEISLLTGANPKIVKKGPLCVLPGVGRWQITHNAKDSKLEFNYRDKAIELNNDPLVVDGGSKCFIVIQSNGTESYVSVNAKLVK